MKKNTKKIESKESKSVVVAEKKSVKRDVFAEFESVQTVAGISARKYVESDIIDGRKVSKSDLEKNIFSISADAYDLNRNAWIVKSRTTPDVSNKFSLLEIKLSRTGYSLISNDFVSNVIRSYCDRKGIVYDYSFKRKWDLKHVVSVASDTDVKAIYSFVLSAYDCVFNRKDRDALNALLNA